MKTTINGQEIELKGSAAASFAGNFKVRFSLTAESILFENGKLKFVEKDSRGNITTHEIENIESTIYDKAVYVYGLNTINGNKTRFILDRK